MKTKYKKYKFLGKYDRLINHLPQTEERKAIKDIKCFMMSEHGVYCNILPASVCVSVCMCICALTGLYISAKGSVIYKCRPLAACKQR